MSNPSDISGPGGDNSETDGETDNEPDGIGGDAASDRPAASRSSRLLWWMARLLGTGAGIAYILYAVDFDDLGTAFARVPLLAVSIALALVAANVLAGALRWHILLRAYGATALPPLAHLTYLSLVGFFYNNYLPGAVGGDLMRGVVTRDAFGHKGMTSAVLVVLVERILGLAGLLALVAGALALGSERFAGAGQQGIDTASLWLWTGIGLIAALGAVIGVALARRSSRWLPGRIGAIATALPRLVSPVAFALAFALSLATQAFIALSGHVLLTSLWPAVSLVDSFVIVPVAMATTFLPITVGGAGAREAAFVALCTALLGMPAADALAVSLAMWFTQLAVGAAGGMLQLFTPARWTSTSNT